MSGAVAMGTGPGADINSGGKKDGGAKKDKNVREKERAPDLGVLQANYNKARAVHNGFVRTWLVEILKNQPFKGNDNSTDSFTTGNSLSEDVPIVMGEVGVKAQNWGQIGPGGKG